MARYEVKTLTGSVSAINTFKARSECEAAFLAESKGLGRVVNIKRLESRVWLLIYPVCALIGWFGFNILFGMVG